MGEIRIFSLPEDLVREFVEWVDRTGEHHGRSWEELPGILADQLGMEQP